MPEYGIVTEHIPSRAVLLAKKIFFIDGKWHTWIDYPRFEQLANSGKEFTSMDYIKPTPKTGISGRGTMERILAKSNRIPIMEI
jgi:tRNA wybutosine-synthesizing protein 1